MVGCHGTNIKKQSIAQITLAQALKEKNRIAGQIRVLWDSIQQENSRREEETRSIDIRKALESVKLYTEKLVELKTKIGLANAGSLEHIYFLEEYKAKMAKLSGISKDEATVYLESYSTGGKEIIRNVVITRKEIREMQHKLQLECNRLQDEMDAYNALTKIDFETPLV